MSYENLSALSQVVAMSIFGAVLLGVVIHALRPANRARFEAAARLPLDGDERIGEQSHGNQ